MTLLDLFSGIGGFSLAASWCNIETIQFVEKNLFCQKVLAKNFPDIPIHDDIKTFNYYKSVDIISGGFPCQPFSVAGSKKGFSDDRWLWPEMFRIIKQCKPRYIIAENVPGFIPYLDTLFDNLESENYTAWALRIPASLIGAPHKRERLWIIAHANGKRCDNGIDSRSARQLQNDIEFNIETIQSEWAQLIPKSWTTFNAQNWLGFTADSYSITSQQANKGAFTKPDEWHSWLGYTRQDRPITTPFIWEENQPPIPGVDDGLPHVVDRNRILGNAIVPQVVYPIFKAIIMENTTSDPIPT